mmetsp:Transcript_22388/g.64264  ORF Transcript_22388/g.64264 Transcript_22388/m.64264 type:complete len:255 (-) Transcript_22388:173-937(-)
MPPISSSISLRHVPTMDLSSPAETMPPGRQTSSGCARRCLARFSNRTAGTPLTLQRGKTTAALRSNADDTLRGIFIRLRLNRSNTVESSNPFSCMSRRFSLLRLICTYFASYGRKTSAKSLSCPRAINAAHSCRVSSRSLRADASAGTVKFSIMSLKSSEGSARKTPWWFCFIRPLSNSCSPIRSRTALRSPLDLSSIGDDHDEATVVSPSLDDADRHTRLGELSALCCLLLCSSSVFVSSPSRADDEKVPHSP